MTDNQQAKHYRKSSKSGGSGGNCVEWAHTAEGVYIRDSKDPEGPELLVTQPEWTALLTAVASDAQHPWINLHSAGADLLKDGHQLRFTTAEWTAFIQAVHAGECTRQALTV